MKRLDIDRLDSYTFNEPQVFMVTFNVSGNGSHYRQGYQTTADDPLTAIEHAKLNRLPEGMSYDSLSEVEHWGSVESFYKQVNSRNYD